MRWTRWAGWLNVVLGVVLGAGFVPIGMAPLGAILFVTLVASGAFMVWLGAGWDKPIEDVAELHRYGRPANARVRSVSDVELRPDGRRFARVKLHVAPVNESDFETTRVLELPGGRVPAVGEAVTVKFDPQKRSNVVLLEQAYLVEDHVTQARKMFEGMAGTRGTGAG